MSKWEMVRLGDVCDVRDGTHDSPKYVNQGYPLITSKNVTKGYIDFSDVNLISYYDYKEINKRSKVDVGDIIMPMIGTIGQPIIISNFERPFAIKNVALIKFNNDHVHNIYVKDILKSTIFKIFVDRISRGGTQKFIALKDIRAFSFPLPPLHIQQKIASILDRTSTLVEKRKEQVSKLDMLVKSQFIKTFGDPVTNPMGWEVVTLSVACKKITDGTHFSPKSYKDGEYKYITAKNIKQDGFDFTNLTYVNESVHKDIYGRCNPEYRDVLYIKDGVTTGIAQINTLTEGFSLLSSVALLKPNFDTISEYYLRDVLNNQMMYTKIRANMGGAAITRLTVAKIKEINIPLPPLALQTRFAEFVQATDKSKSETQRSLDNLELLYKSLMQQYFC